MHNDARKQQRKHLERMVEHMSASGKWAEGFVNCCKKVQGVIIY